MNQLVLRRSVSAPNAQRRRRWSAPVRLYGGFLTLLPAVAVAVVVGWIAVNSPDLYRALFAVGLMAVLSVVALRAPVTGAVACLVVLPFIALGRRLLIADAGSTGYDPIILVGPVVAGILLYRLFVAEGRPLATDRISLLVLIFAVLAGLQAFNPAGGGVSSGLVGLLFIAAPLMWFFIGREVATDRAARTMLQAFVVIGAIAGVYGLIQTQIGFPSWDRNWLETSGYAALNVGDAKRPFSSFSSSAEYAFWIASSIVVGTALVTHGRASYLLLIPVLVVALVLTGVRSPLISGLLALVIVLGLRTKRPPLAAAVVVLGLALAVVAGRAYGGSAEQASSGNDLVARQVSGINDPLDPNKSTLLLHADLVVNGVRSGFEDPLGRGAGSSNLAATKVGKSGGGSTEVDVSNAFVSLGLIGGLLFVAILIAVLRHATRIYLHGNDLALGVLGLLVVTLGQWLTGGHYALAPLTWFLIGWTCRHHVPEVSTRLRRRSLPRAQEASVMTAR